jgi:hypothetical protein
MMCDLACIAGFAVVTVITVAMVLNCEGLLCFGSRGLGDHQSRRPYRPLD